MATLLYTDPRFVDHDTPAGHPERPERMTAVAHGVERCVAGDDLVAVEPRLASADEMECVHDRQYLDALAQFCDNGGGRLDPDTSAARASWDVARLAAGAGLDAAERLRAGEADSAFLAVRPPGHHATPSRAMGFCLVNNVAICAATLADAGERVMVVDIDAHHGNGTQDAFWDDPRVTYISIHQHPIAPGGIVNIPVPAHTPGDVYRQAIDEIVVPVAERTAPTWLLVSAGFDAHRADPLTDLGLSAGDYGDLTSRLLALVPAQRRLVFLEGGYDLDAVSASTAATLAAMAGVDDRTEAVTSGSDGAEVIATVRRLHHIDT